MKRKVFGYSQDGDARKFVLNEGEDLPAGWSPEPFPSFSRHELDVRPEMTPIPAQFKRKPKKGR